MSEIKLLPCPFCGGEAELIKRKSNFPYIHGVWCIRCNCRTSFEKSEEIAIEKWNNRNPVEDVLERLEAECIKYKNEWNTYDDEIAFGQMNGMSNAISIIKEGLME